MLLVSDAHQILGVARALFLPPDPLLLEYFIFFQESCNKPQTEGMSEIKGPRTFRGLAGSLVD